MNCNKCGDKPTTVAEVLSCKICRDDGTANEIPKDMGPNEQLVGAVVRRAGLANRFSLPASTPTPTPTPTIRPPSKKNGK